MSGDFVVVSFQSDTFRLIAHYCNIAHYRSFVSFNMPIIFSVQQADLAAVRVG